MSTTHHLLADCRWPELQPPYAAALEAAVTFILQRFEPLGIIASGTIVRGTPDPSSDLDIYVIHAAPFRQRLQRFFNGVPAEIFVNPAAAVRTYFAEERTARRPITAHMLATGCVVLERDPIVAELRAEAAWQLADPPPPPADLTAPRYLAATLLEDALDLVARDPAAARRLLGQVVDEMLQLAFTTQGKYLPRHKGLLATLATFDAPAAALARSIFQAATLAEQVIVAGELADRLIGTRGFFEWESQQLPVHMK